jgi:hypothetical protein
MNGTEATAPRAADGALERFALARLERFLERAAAADASGTDQWRALARHAVFSAYRDCLALGLAAEARAILTGDARSAGTP